MAVAPVAEHFADSRHLVGRPSPRKPGSGRVEAVAASLGRVGRNRRRDPARKTLNNPCDTPCLKSMCMPISEVENTVEFPADAPDSVTRGPRILRSRIIIFVTVFLTVLLAANWFVCATWNFFLGIAAVPAWEFIFPALTLAFVITTFLGRRHSSVALRLVYRISAV